MRRAGTARTRPAGRFGREGFLLVEALATLAISAFVLAGLASLLGLMLRTADRATERVQSLETTGRTLAALAREIEGLARVRWADEAAGFVFTGEPDRVLFARDADPARDPSAIVIQSVATGGGGRVLQAEAALNPGARSAADLRFEPARTLYQGPAAVRFSYVAHPSAAGGEEVLDAWIMQAALPKAVRISLLDPATGAVITSRRVRILVDAEPGCAAPQATACSRIDRAAGDAGPSRGGGLGPALAGRR